MAYTKDALLQMAAADPRLVQAGGLLHLFDVADEIEIAYWAEYDAFAASLEAVCAYPGDVTWQVVDVVADDVSHVVVTAHGVETAILKGLPVVVREAAR